MNLSTPPCLVIEVAVEPRSDSDAQTLAQALQAMTGEDELFQAVSNPETSQIVLKGADEEQLDVKIGLLRESYGIDLWVGQPQVSYRETITKRIEVAYTHKRRIGQSGQFAKIEIRLEPDTRGAGNTYMWQAAETIPEEYAPSVKTGIDGALNSGVYAGFPVVDIRMIVDGGAYHDTDSSPLAFEIAARAACREALRGAEPRLLEPFMSVEVHAPEEYAGFIKGDLESRRGVVERIDHREGMAIITTDVPMTNMFGYGNQLRAFSQGFGTFSMRYKDYRVLDSLNNPDNPSPAAAAALRA
jgi:elongation factor G